MMLLSLAVRHSCATRKTAHLSVSRNKWTEQALAVTGKVVGHLRVGILGEEFGV